MPTFQTQSTAVSILPPAIFNTVKTDYDDPTIVLGQRSGVFDTIHNHHPKILSLFAHMRSLDWHETEFDFGECRTDFQQVAKGTHDAMVENLAYQWETDAVAATVISRILPILITNDAARRHYVRIADNENLHTATYSAIIHQSFGERSKEVLDYVLGIKETYERLDVVANVFETTRRMVNKYEDGDIENDQALYNQAILFIFTILTMERVQFMTSFSTTFAIVETGVFGPIGDAVQKICQDEFEVHIQTHAYILAYEFSTERGKIALQQMRGEFARVLNEVVASEDRWSDFTFRDNRALIGITKDTSFAWARFSATDLVIKFDLHDLIDFEPVTENPLPFMESWVDISLVQPSPQEEDGNQYKMNVMVRDDSEINTEIDLF